MSLAAKPLSLKDTLRFLLTTLVKMAKRHEWGQLTITIQNGQIVFVEEKLSYRDRLPELAAGIGEAEFKRELAAVAG